MKKQERIIKKIEANKEIMKGIQNVRIYTPESFYKDALRYIKAIKEGRMCCVIPHVSQSGMSRVIKFHECAKGRDKYRFYNFFAFMLALGYTPDRARYGFRIGGAGMDMVFHTNYTIIHRLGRLGFITKKQVEALAQNTPEVL